MPLSWLDSLLFFGQKLIFVWVCVYVCTCACVCSKNILVLIFNEVLVAVGFLFQTWEQGPSDSAN